MKEICDLHVTSSVTRGGGGTIAPGGALGGHRICAWGGRKIRVKK